MHDVAPWDRRPALAIEDATAADPPIHRPAPGKRTLTQRLPARRDRRDRGLAAVTDLHQAAADGVAGAGAALPFHDQLSRAFGLDLSDVTAHVGGAAAEACDALGAEAYATGASVAFRAAPDLHTAAHEAAHVVQQRAGLDLPGGLGAAGDVHERHADAVADRVVAGASAADLLAAYVPAGGPATAVQRRARPPTQVTLLGVTLTASSTGADFMALEAQARDADIVDRLHAAAGRGVAALKAMLASWIPDGVDLVAYGALLTAIADRYVAWRGEVVVDHDAPDPRTDEDDGPATRLRAAIVGFGYHEKVIYADTPGEIDSGGPIQASLATAAIAVLGRIYAELPGLHLEVTGGNDKFHQPPRFAPNSHSRGEALDFKIVPAGADDLDAVAAILHACARRYKGPIDVDAAAADDDHKPLAFAQDEYRAPSPKSSGNHFHINV